MVVFLGCGDSDNFVALVTFAKCMYLNINLLCFGVVATQLRETSHANRNGGGFGSFGGGAGGSCEVNYAIWLDTSPPIESNLRYG